MHSCHISSPGMPIAQAVKNDRVLYAVLNGACCTTLFMFKSEQLVHFT